MKRILFYLFVLITLQPSTTRAQQLSTLRYWFDNDASRIYTQPFRFTAGDEVDVLLDASALTSGLHSIVIQVARGDSVFSPTEAALFVKMPPSPPGTVGKRTLYYWFDQNHGAQSSIDLSSTTNETNLLISTTTLPEGLHTLNTYIVDESGERSPVFSGLFLS